MNIRYFLLAAALIPFISQAGESLFFKPKSTCSGGQQERANSLAVRLLNDLNQEKTPTIEAFCSELRATTNPVDSQCYASCESQYREYFDQVKEAKREAEAKKIAVRQEEERRAAEQQQAESARVSALKAGQVKPANLKEAAIAYNAEHGGALASAPKIKPDGGLYYMNGKIKMAGDRPEFLAALSSSQDNELLANALRRSRGMGESTNYFAVVIPDQLQKYYFNGAKIEGGFDLVGRYVSNTKYKTVAGQEKSAPVFEAIYLVFWQ